MPINDSLRLIVPFLRPIQSLLEDETISEIMVNGNCGVFIERCGLLEEMPGIVLDSQQLLTGTKNIARQLGKDFGRLVPCSMHACPMARESALLGQTWRSETWSR